jgi:hypothetical protein
MHAGGLSNEHLRWVTTPETLANYAGRPAIRFRLVDVANSAQLLVFADPVTLQIHTTFEA